MTLWQPAAATRISQGGKWAIRRGGDLWRAAGQVHSGPGVPFHLPPQALGLAVGETDFLLNPPDPFSRCFNMDGEGVPVK